MPGKRFPGLICQKSVRINRAGSMDLCISARNWPDYGLELLFLVPI